MLKNLKFKKNKAFSIALAMLISSSTILPNFIPIHSIYASDSSTINISSWAIPTINEAEKYNIFSTDWYFDDFTGSISQDKLDYILNGVNNKLASLDLQKKDNFITHSLNSSISNLSRGNIAIQLFNLLDQYEFGQYFSNPIDYFTQKEIIKGDGINLNLEQVCTTEQAIVIATNFIEAIYSDLDAGSKGFVWQVQNNENIVYLLGSIHLGTTDIYPINQKLKDAFDSSDSLHVEVNIFGDEDNIYDFIRIAMYQDGHTIKDYISNDLYQKLGLVCDLLDISLDYLSLFKPWSIANDLNNYITTQSQNQEGVQSATEHGVDMYFLTRSIAADKTINELESYQMQAMIFDSMSYELQLENLEYAVNQILLYNIFEENLVSENSEVIIEALFNDEIAFENIALLDNFDYVDDIEDISYTYYKEEDLGTEVLDVNLGTEVLGANLGTGVVDANLGTGVVDANLGTGVVDANLGTGVLGANLGTEVLGANLGTEVVDANLGTEVLDANLGTGVVEANLGTEVVDANLGTGVVDANLGTGVVDANLGTEVLDANLGTEVNQNQTIENWLNYFKAGDVDSITKEFYELVALNDGDEEYSSTILDSTRNYLMANKIVELLEAEGKGTHFVVVGAAHFIVDGSILDILKDNGYEVQNFYQ